MGTTDLGTIVHIEKEGGLARIFIAGNITAESDFSEVGAVDAKRVVLDIAQLNRFNSRGVLLWMQMLDGLCKRVSNVEIRNAGHAFMQQYSMIRHFAARASIESINARVLCERCGQTAEVTLERSRDFPQGRPVKTTIPPCSSCRTAMIPDDEVFELDLTPDRV